MKVKYILPILIVLAFLSCMESDDSSRYYVHYHMVGLYIGKLDPQNSYDSLDLEKLSEQFNCLLELEKDISRCEAVNVPCDPFLNFDGLNEITNEVVLSNDSVYFQSAYFDNSELLFVIKNESEKADREIYLRSDKSLDQLIDFIGKDTSLIFSRLFFPKIKDENLRFTP